MLRICLIVSFIATSITGENFDSKYKDSVTARFRLLSDLTVKNGGIWGLKKHEAYCPEGTFAKGYALKIEPDQGSGDDTALNNIALLCAQRHASKYNSVVVSPKPMWGKWADPIICNGSDYFMASFILNIETALKKGDDTAANDVSFRCRKFDGSQQRIIDCNYKKTWGVYGEWSSSCPYGSAICGMETKYEPKIDGDDTALNDVSFYCCNF